MKAPWPLLSLLAQVGCGQLFGLDEPIRVDAAAPIDETITPDSNACAGTSLSCASADVLRTCETAGTDPVDTTCVWGCSTSGASAHCAQILPAGGVATTVDTENLNALADVVIPTATIDTDNGSISAGIRGSGQGVTNGIEFILRSSGGVFRMKSLSITGVVQVRGSRPLVVVAEGGISIMGGVDARGSCTGNQAGPGGFAGGLNGASATGSGAGTGGMSAGDDGGGGGGHGGSGGSGGSSLVTKPAPGAPFGDAAITVLRGGGGGGSGGASGDGGSGGGGGGAIQLISNQAITIASTGVLNAGGCGGKVATGISDSGGGGGAGGTILLEAHDVTIAGVLAVNGGGGAGGDDNAGPGAAGRPDRTRAMGGNATNGDEGGAGGAASFRDGLPGNQSDCAGGGGGGVGRIRVNTRSGSATVAGSAVMSPAFTDSPTTATQGAVVVQ